MKKDFFLIIGVIIILVSLITLALIMQFATAISYFDLIASNESYYGNCLEYINPISFICIGASLLTGIFFIIKAIRKK